MAEITKENSNNPMFSQNAVAEMLEEVQKATTHRILETLKDMIHTKERELAPPFLTLSDIQLLEENYEAHSQSASGE